MSVLLIFVALLILYIIRIDFRKIYLAFKIPGPFPLPFVGNGLLYINKTSTEILRISEKLINYYGDTFGIWIQSDFHVFVGEPKSVEVLLSSSKYNEKSSVYKYLKPWLNDGLLLSSGPKWVQRRKMLTPAFHFKILEEFVEIFDRQTSVLIQNLSQYSQSDKVELFPFTALYALDVICESAMGVQMDAQRSCNTEYVHAVKTVTHIVHERMIKFMLREDFLFRFSSLYYKEKKALKIIHDFTDNIIKERRNKTLTQESNNKEGNADIYFGQKRNFLDILLRSTMNGSPLSDLDIREEVDTFLGEGYDTTASGIIFCLYNIAKHSKVQQKCFQEIRDVLGDDRTKSVSLNSLNNLNYLDLVIKETLRMFPSVPFISRKLREECNIGKYILPKGSDVVIPIYLMGHNPKLFPDPELFLPERFLVGKTADEVSSFTYIPFSAGPRNCIGQKFAVLKIKSVVSKLLRYFEISLAEDSLQNLNLMAEVVLISENKINFYIKPRVY